MHELQEQKVDTLHINELKHPFECDYRHFLLHVVQNFELNLYKLKILNRYKQFMYKLYSIEVFMENLIMYFIIYHRKNNQEN